MPGVGLFDLHRMRDDSLTDERPERFAELDLDVLGRSVIVSPSQNQARDSQCSIVEILPHFLDRRLQATEARDRVETRIDGHKQLARVVQKVDPHEVELRGGVHHDQVILVIDGHHRGPQPPLSAHLIGQQKSRVGEPGIRRDQIHPLDSRRADRFPDVGLVKQDVAERWIVRGISVEHRHCGVALRVRIDQQNAEIAIRGPDRQA